jgi:outer membrane protein assembly factor BamB
MNHFRRNKINRHAQTVLSFAILFLCVGPANSADWPIFRGDPALTGRAAGSLPDSLSLIWIYNTGDDIKSSPVIAGQTIYIGSDDDTLYALDLQTGKLQWGASAGSAIEAPPLVLDDRVIVGALDGAVRTFEAGTGHLIWTYDTGQQIMGSANWAGGSRKLGKRIIIGSYDHQIHCLNAESGKLVWAYNTDNFINGAPAVDQTRIVFGGCDALLHLVSIHRGKKIGQIDLGSYIAGSPAVENGFAYVGHYGNQVACVDLSRKAIVWTFGDEDTGAPFFSSPAIGETGVLIGSRDETVYYVHKKTGRLLWKFRTQNEVDSSPVICGDKAVVCSCDGWIYLLAMKDGRELWSYEIGEAITGSPAVADGWLVIGAEDGRVYGFRGL